MKLNGLHFLLTYQCTFECEHCFVWGSPWQSGTMTLDKIRTILDQADELGTIEEIYFEGGEPFLYYPILLQGAVEAARHGYGVGIVSNAYWATSLEDAIQWLAPLQDIVKNLTVSSDLFHYNEKISRQAQYASQAAEMLNIPSGMITIDRPDVCETQLSTGQIPEGESGVMFRGRAAVQLAPNAPVVPRERFVECPYENLVDPGRVHVDPLGYLHICQGISIGNLFETPLVTICARYAPHDHPIVGPLLDGGPLLLAQRYGVESRECYADACQMCYETRIALRERFGSVLTPDQMYGINLGSSTADT
jgi:hypothetical protein